MQENKELKFGGVQRLYGVEGYHKLTSSHVMIAGIGGVGSWVAESLARTAVGQITLIDLDDVCVTNTNRQIHAMTSTVGKLKVEVMADRIKDINPDCQVNVVSDFISAKNQQEILSSQPDYVVDAIDSVPAKVALIAFCKRNKIKIITIGGAGGQIDPLKIEVKDLSRTNQDPLAAKVRSELRRKHNFTKNPKRKFSIECVYSEEQLIYPTPDGSTCYQKQFDDGSVKLDCSGGLGASVMVTSTFGMVAASRVVNYLVNKKPAEAG
ncbi:MAG: tRNA cyclic N6-threonylcarbamoyladenosine(37) synthase TcdA [Gammaproteobacteria bacterium]|nr:tRNA cyclic N6-threonylcarbamoyladenosine(37) synthase TcdA [Gammaproteobacteria bacterium]MDH5630090.1 tRNA cyclic N6-threonylcarbamoyladenosine(37) synthase TcdA [Gammaproteobacteria bacterium]